jgi:hypothetical protein
MTALFIAAGCAAPKTVWRSNPEVTHVSTDKLTAQVKPIKLDEPFFVAFEVMVQNKMGVPLKIDWNKTRYFYNKKNSGLLVFQGINPEDFKNRTIPHELIPAGKTMVKRLSPARTVAWITRHQRAKGDEPVFKPGILPKGISTVSLSLTQGGHTWRQNLSIQIVEDPIN